MELVQKMSNLPATPIREVAPDVSEPYARIIDKALQFRREDRYENASEMQVDVRRALSELAPTARPPPVARPSPTVDVPLDVPPLEKPAPETPVEPTIELSESDIVRPPQFGLDESIRIPKRRSFLPWLLLLVVAAAGVKAWPFLRRMADDAMGSGEPGADTSAGSNAAADPEAGLRGSDAGSPKGRPILPHRPFPTKPGATGPSPTR